MFYILIIGGVQMSLKLGVVGTGAIGKDHIKRLAFTLNNVELIGVTDIVEGRAEQVLDELGLSNIKIYRNDIEMLPDVDAVMITASSVAHAEIALHALNAGKYVFCEKPLATTAEDCLKIMEAEKKYNKRLLQVGFMRRYDKGYQELKQAIEEGVIGNPLILHCRHYNPVVSLNYTTEMLITETLIHEIDVLHWLIDDDYQSVQVIYPKNSTIAEKQQMQDPQVVILRTKSGICIIVEIFVSCQYGYDIQCEVVGEKGIASLPEPTSINLRLNGEQKTTILMDWKERFIEAYDVEIQHFIDQIVGENTLTGPSAWDGYIAAITADACVNSQKTSAIEEVVLVDKPDFY